MGEGRLLLEVSINSITGCLCNKLVSSGYGENVSWNSTKDMTLHGSWEFWSWVSVQNLEVRKSVTLRVTTWKRISVWLPTRHELIAPVATPLPEHQATRTEKIRLLTHEAEKLLDSS